MDTSFGRPNVSTTNIISSSSPSIVTGTASVDKAATKDLLDIRFLPNGALERTEGQDGFGSTLSWNYEETLTEDTYTLFDDNKIRFIDSGAPNTSQKYTTLIILHGTGFTAGGFEGIVSLASSNNLRAVAMNRLGYPGSTPYNQSDLANLQSGKKESLDRIAFVLAAFIKTFIEKENISKTSEGGG
ncbi:hypothetical protein MPER_08457, partial [Moniliophthora perniciosa FA553]